MWSLASLIFFWPQGCYLSWSTNLRMLGSLPPSTEIQLPMLWLLGSSCPPPPESEACSPNSSVIYPLVSHFTPVHAVCRTCASPVSEVRKNSLLPFFPQLWSTLSVFEILLLLHAVLLPPPPSLPMTSFIQCPASSSTSSASSATSQTYSRPPADVFVPWVPHAHNTKWDKDRAYVPMHTVTHGTNIVQRIPIQYLWLYTEPPMHAWNDADR